MRYARYAININRRAEAVHHKIARLIIFIRLHIYRISNRRERTSRIRQVKLLRESNMFVCEHLAYASQPRNTNYKHRVSISNRSDV